MAFAHARSRDPTWNGGLNLSDAMTHAVAVVLLFLPL